MARGTRRLRFLRITMLLSRTSGCDCFAELASESVGDVEQVSPGSWEAMVGPLKRFRPLVRSLAS